MQVLYLAASHAAGCCEPLSVYSGCTHTTAPLRTLVDSMSVSGSSGFARAHARTALSFGAALGSGISLALLRYVQATVQSGNPLRDIHHMTSCLSSLNTG